MRNRFLGILGSLFFIVTGVRGQEVMTMANGPDEDPQGNTGALREQVETGGSFSAHSGNASRIVPDLRVPNALGTYGLDFTRYWNSLNNADINIAAEWPTDFGYSGWSHSWRWKAVYDEEWPEGENAPALRMYVTSITVTFPDGHATKFKVTRYNGSYYPWGADGRVGPPYRADHYERNWASPGPGVHDNLAEMAYDGSEFWLYRADGGSVHFVGTNGSNPTGGYKWWRYKATEIYDPHGLRTALVYEGEEDHPYLKRVVQEDGRWLQINWANYNGQAVIGSVQTGSAGSQQVVQQVDYGYSGSGSSFILRQVFYNDTPAIGQAASAIYDYQPNVLSGPSLKRADDPTFAGAMTKIGYNYYGQACSLPTPVPTPVEIHDWYDFLPEAITAETSGETGQMVAGFQPVCHDGTRTDFNGLGGWRTLYYGGSAHDSEIGVNLGHSLTKVTDFVKENTPTSAGPSRKQNGAEPSKMWDGRHIRTELTYDGSGGVATIHHPADGSTARFDRINPGNSANPDGSRMHNQQHHWLFSKTDELGNRTVYRRDERRRVTDISYYDRWNTLVASETYSYNIWNQVETHRLASNAVETYEYDPATHLLIRESNNVDGPVKEYDYDGLGRIWRMRDARAIAEGALYTERMEYNGWHQITKIHYRATGGSSDPTVKYEYDNYGNRTAVIDELGHRKDYTYDSYRRCTSLTEQVGCSAGCNNVQVRQWNWLYDREIEYAPNDRRMFVASTHTSKEWRIQIEPEFNADHDRRATSRVFDVNNRMISEVTGLIQKQGDALGTLQSVPGITEMHSVHYDDNGQKSTSTDPLQRVTSYEYDGRNRLKTTTGPSRLNQVNPVTTFDYDVAGNKTKVTLPGPEQYTQEWSDFDAFGQARTFTNENRKITNLTYKWGPMKKLETVRTYREMDDGAGQETQLTSFDYDGMGRLKKTVFPDTASVVSEESTYRFGQLETWKTRRNQTKRLFYDARGRESYHTWDNDAAPGITRVWDDANRLTSISNVFSTIAYAYDGAGQVCTESTTVAGEGVARAIGYCRYPSGEVSQMTYPNGTVINRFYTPRGQLKGVGWGVGSTSYEYNPDGTVDLQAWDHVSTRYGYDGRGMVSSILHRNTAAGRDLARRDYWRDDRDRIKAWKRGIDNSLNGMEDGLGDRYDYDPEGQLEKASYRVANPESSPGVALRTDIFHYDELGNRVRGNHIASLGWMDIKRRNNGLNQYESWENDRPVTDPHHWGSGIFHDDNIPPPAPSPPPATPPPNPWVSPGNGVLMEDGYVVAGFNALNQPVGIWSFAYRNTPNWMWFGYDPLGRCVKRWVAPYGVAPTNATYYYYDGWNLIQEGPNGASADIVYVHGGRVDEIVASKAGGNWRQHHYDAGGNCILLTNSTTGTILEQYDYDAFGRPYFYSAGGSGLGLSSPQGNRFLFTGREWIKELRLYDYRARMYQPELGRFLQPDPKEFAAGDYNLYRYCHNDPVNKTDPFGLQDERLSDQMEKKKKEEPKLVREVFKTTYSPTGTHLRITMRYTESGNWNNTKIADHYKAGIEGGKTEAWGKTTQEEALTWHMDLHVDWFVGNGYKNSDVVTRELQHVQDFRDFSAAYARSLGNVSPTNFSRQVADKLEESRNHYDGSKAQQQLLGASLNKPHNLSMYPKQSATLPEFENTASQVPYNPTSNPPY